jgi:hypothetical protein
MNYEDRQLLKSRISEIQREKEERARRMHVKDANGERLYLGGGSRPENEQVKSGYPSFWDQANNKGGRVETVYICGCDYRDPHIQRYGVTVHSDGSITNKRYDRNGYEVCPIHGLRLRGWATVPRTSPPIGAMREPSPKGDLGSEIPDRRDNRDPATVGEEWLGRQEANGTPQHTALSKPAPMVEMPDPDTGQD